MKTNRQSLPLLERPISSSWTSFASWFCPSDHTLQEFSLQRSLSQFSHCPNTIPTECYSLWSNLQIEQTSQTLRKYSDWFRTEWLFCMDRETLLVLEFEGCQAVCSGISQSEFHSKAKACLYYLRPYIKTNQIKNLKDFSVSQPTVSMTRHCPVFFGVKYCPIASSICVHMWPFQRISKHRTWKELSHG